jgi:hypothetical protein
MRNPIVAGALLWAVSLVAGPAAAGQIKVLSFNVRGLPPELIEDRSTEMPQIASKIEEFRDGSSVAVFQELFDPGSADTGTGYYDTLTDPAVVMYPNITAKDNSGTVFPVIGALGNGLTTMSDFNILTYDTITWTRPGDGGPFDPGCFGTFGANGSDCDTNKGFSRARIELAPGFEVLVYNLHADAGGDGSATSGSIQARRNNILQIIDDVATNGVGDAIIAMGDWNSHYWEVGANGDNIDIFNDMTGTTDAWVEFALGGVEPGAGAPNESGCPPPEGTGSDASGPNCELVDKIFYRGSSTVLLSLTQYAVLDGLFVDGGGNPLSDHLAPSAVFDYTLIPEPATALQLLLGLTALAARARRRCS